MRGVFKEFGREGRCGMGGVGGKFLLMNGHQKGADSLDFSETIKLFCLNHPGEVSMMSVSVS